MTQTYFEITSRDKNCPSWSMVKAKRIREIFSFDANDTPLARQSADENDPAIQRSAHTEEKVKRICAYKKENFHYAVRESMCGLLIAVLSSKPPFFL